MRFCREEELNVEVSEGLLLRVTQQALTVILLLATKIPLSIFYLLFLRYPIDDNKFGFSHKGICTFISEKFI